MANHSDVDHRLARFRQRPHPLTRALRPAWGCALLLSLLLRATPAVSQPDPGQYFKITVVDAATGRGVPLVELATTNAIKVQTDSNGIVAWNEPGLMDRDVYFSISSHGYLFPDSGRTLRVTRGGSVVLKLDRVNIAERLYRITGQGIYRDSLLSGTPVPLREPLLNAEVMGQDSVFVTPYQGKLFWLWDDTSRAAGPLGSLTGCWYCFHSKWISTIAMTFRWTLLGTRLLIPFPNMWIWMVPANN